MNIPPFLQDKDQHNSVAPRFYRRTEFWVIVLIILIIIIFFQHFPFKSKKQTPAVPVMGTVVKKMNVPVYLNQLGSVVPVSTITIKTQINGLLMKVLFKEGQMVKAGDLLAEIDMRPYEAQLVQYQGQLVRDTALLTNANMDLQRYKTLWKQNSVSKQTLDTQAALVQQYLGAVQIDNGLIQTVEVNLTYCKIISPIDGRIGLRLVDPGNFVQTSDTTGIARVDSLAPITVIFSIPEDNVPDVLEQINAGKQLIVEAYDRQQNKLLSTGTLLTMDNQIDTTTGTVKMRAQFTNQNKTLFPNQFVNAKLLVKTLANAVVTSTAAIQNGPKGDYVFVVNENNTISVKPVQTGITYQNNIVVTKGLSPGQIVIVEGVDKLAEGTNVNVTNKQAILASSKTTNGLIKA